MFEIETHNLTRSFGNLVAVRDLNLKVQKGTIFGFLGPNGAGKSTTVSMLTGLLRPTAGDALIGGASILTSPLEVKKKIGVLPEELALFEAPGVPWIVILVTLVSLALYALSLVRFGRRFEQRREQIAHALS